MNTGKLNVAPEGHLGNGELTTMLDFLHNSIKACKDMIDLPIGVIKSVISDPQFNNFRIIPSISPNKIVIPSGSSAYDSAGNRINIRYDSEYTVPSGTWYVKISYEEDTTEEGTVSISATGEIVGVGTSFLDKIRGQAMFPVKIKFIDSINNTGEYIVSEVIDDTNMVLLGSSFMVESGLSYEIIGTFTEGETIPELSKRPYRYDGCKVEFVDVTPENKSSDGSYFIVAKVTNTIGVISVDDMRGVRGSAFMANENTYTASDLFGIEGIRYAMPNMPKDKSVILIGWGLRITGYTVNSGTMTIIVDTIEETGRIKSVAQVADDMLNGCRVYRKDGGYDFVNDCTYLDGVLYLKLDSLSPELYDGTTLNVTYDCDYLNIISSVDVGAETNNKIVHSSDCRAEISIAVGIDDSNSKISFSLIDTAHRYSGVILPSDDTDNGYYAESSYNSDGTLKAVGERSRVIYTPSTDDYYIAMVESASSYRKMVARVDKGDNYDFAEIDLADIDNAEEIVLEVGVSANEISIIGSNSYTSDLDIVVGNPINDGNEFIFNFNITDIIFSDGETINIIHRVDESTDNIIYSFNSDDIARTMSGGFEVRIWSYNNTWKYSSIKELYDNYIKSDVLEITGSFANGYEWEIANNVGLIRFGNDTTGVTLTSSSSDVPTKVILPEVRKSIGRRIVVEGYEIVGDNQSGHYLSFGSDEELGWTEVICERTINPSGNYNISRMSKNYTFDRFYEHVMHKILPMAVLPSDISMCDEYEILPTLIVLRCYADGWKVESANSYDNTGKANGTRLNAINTGSYSSPSYYRRSLAYLSVDSGDGKQVYIQDAVPLFQNSMFVGGWTRYSTVSDTHLIDVDMFYRVDRAGYLEVAGRFTINNTSVAYFNPLTGGVVDVVLASLHNPPDLFKNLSLDTVSTLCFPIVVNRSNTNIQMYCRFSMLNKRFSFEIDPYASYGQLLQVGDVVILSWRFPFAIRSADYNWVGTSLDPQ